MSAVAARSEVIGAVLSAALGVLLVVAAVLGPLISGRIRFHMSSDAVVQYVGGEVATVLAAVVLLASVPAWGSGRLWAPAVAAGASAYVVYTFVTVVAGEEYVRYPGNVERAFLLYAAITAAATALLVTSARTLAASDGVTGPHRLTGWVLPVVAGVIALLWIGQLAGFYRSGPTPEYESATALFWLIKYLDLGVLVPLAVIIGLLQHSASPSPSPSRAANAAAITMLGFLTWLLLALVLMAVEMLRRATPGASVVLAIGAFVVLIPVAALWVSWLIRSD